MDSAADAPPPQRRGSMTVGQERERRASIQAIMKDPHLTPQERRKSIQYLMDGRRRSSTEVNGDTPRASMTGTNNMAAAAAAASAGFDESSDEEDDANGMVDPDVRLLRRQSSGRGLPNFFRRSQSNLSSDGGRRTSLRNSFTMGFSKMGVKSSANGNAGVKSDAPPDPNALARKMEQSRPPCTHYQRNCSIVSPCCGLVFGCRICHDDSPVLPPPFLLTGGQASAAHLAAVGMTGASHTMEEVTVAKAPPPKLSHRSASLPQNFEEEESHHDIDRFLIKEVICRECFTRQSSKT